MKKKRKMKKTNKEIGLSKISKEVKNLWIKQNSESTQWNIGKKEGIKTKITDLEADHHKT